MGFGPSSLVAELVTVDQSAPGAPGVTLEQRSNTVAAAIITYPTVDADQTPLSGLTGGQMVVVRGDAGVLAGLSFDEAMAIDGAMVAEWNVVDGESNKTIEFTIVDAGRSTWSAIARMRDHVV